MDGTLIDSSPDLALAVNHMLTTLNRNTFSTDTIHYWVGNGAQTLVKRALSGSSTIDKTLDPTLFEEALAIFLDFYTKNLIVKTKTYPNVKNTLTILHRLNYRLAIATNKPFAFVEPILKVLELSELFELILGGDSLEEKKPSPLPLLHICKTLNVDVKDAVMLGDSKNDILAANACGMHSVGFTYGYNYGEDINIYKPNFVFDEFADILSTI